MANIRINSLPADASPNANDVAPVDGLTTRKITLTDFVNAGRPFASQAEAEAGVNAVHGMSPLTTAQAIAAQGAVAFVPVGQGVPSGGTLNQVLGKTSGSDFAMSWRNAGAGDLISANNLSDVANPATALANLKGQPLYSDRDLKVTAIQAAPPGSPAAGDTYILAASPSGLWSGFAKDQLAVWNGTIWSARSPVDGELANVGTGPAVAYNYDTANTKWIGQVPRGTGSWLQGKGPAIISRAAPKFLTPEMYIGLETQIVYCPAGEPTNYSGATNFKPAFDAMRAEMLSLLLNTEWPPTSSFNTHRAPFGVALQPGHRYALDSGVNFTNFNQEGFAFEGNGGSLVGRYAGGAAVLDLIGCQGWTVNDLRIESDNGAQPSMACLIGRPTVNAAAGAMQFNDCYFDGWFQRCTMGNFAAEVSGWRGGQIINYNTAPAFWLDSTNSIDVASYTQASGVSLGSPGSVNASAIMHTIERTSLRCIQETPTGALCVTTAISAAEDNAVRKVRLDNVYLTNSGTDTDTVKPGVYVKGNVNDFYMDIHCEAQAAGATIQLSHLVYYDTTSGEQQQYHHTIIEHLSDAEVACIGKSNDANMLYLIDADVTVIRARGTNASGVDAKLFDANLATQCAFGGTVRVGPDIDLLDMTKVLRFTGDIHTFTSPTNVSMPATGRARLISPVMPYGGVTYLSQKSVTANGAFDAEDADFIVLSGSVTAVSLVSAFRHSQLSILNTTANFVVLSGLAGPNAIIPPNMTAILLRNGTNVHAATLGTYVGVYAPTLVGVANVDSAVLTDSDLRYTLVGTNARVSGRVTIDPTAAANTVTTVRVPLPIASNLADGSDLSGSVCNASGLTVGTVTADATNDAAQINFLSGTTAAVGYTIDFEYQLK